MIDPKTLTLSVGSTWEVQLFQRYTLLGPRPVAMDLLPVGLAARHSGHGVQQAGQETACPTDETRPQAFAGSAEGGLLRQTARPPSETAQGAQAHEGGEERTSTSPRPGRTRSWGLIAIVR